MRVSIGAHLAAIGFLSCAASAQVDVCTNIRLSVSEQIECRGRVTNALGDLDRQRIQQEFEDRVRRANDQLIIPPVLNAPQPATTSAVPSTARPPTPRAPDRPRVPGEVPATGTFSASPAGQLTKPGEAPPSGSAIVPDLTAPDPTDSSLPPISPLSVNPAGSFAKPN